MRVDALVAELVAPRRSVNAFGLRYPGFLGQGLSPTLLNRATSPWDYPPRCADMARR
jgi:hypothetical protein